MTAMGVEEDKDMYEMYEMYDTEYKDTDEETLKDLVERIRSLEDFINEMIDQVLPREDHICADIFDCTIDEFKRSRELQKLNDICNGLDFALEMQCKNKNENENKNETDEVESQSDSNSSDALVYESLRTLQNPGKYVNDFQNLVFDLERSFLVLELFWLDKGFEKLDFSHLNMSITA